MNRTFAVPAALHAYQLSKVGHCRTTNSIYVSPRMEDRIQVWRCNAMVPSSWEIVVDIPYEEVLFAVFALSQDGAEIGVLAICVAVRPANASELAHAKVLFLEFDTTQKNERKTYALDASSGAMFDSDLFLDKLILGHSSRHGWFVYDRSVVTGPIPFWTISFISPVIPVQVDEQGTFVIESRFVPEESQEDPNCSQRYPVLLDGTTRKFAKFHDDNNVAIFDEATNRWHRYRSAANSDLAVSSRSRGIGETITRKGHRVGAVESPFQVLADAPCCVGKLYEHGTHRFYSLDIDEDSRTIVFKLMAVVKLSREFDRQFYPLVTPSEVIFISSEYLAIVSYRPLSLRSIVCWAIQKITAEQNAIGAWTGGLNEQNLKQLCGYKGQRLLA